MLSADFPSAREATPEDAQHGPLRVRPVTGRSDVEVSLVVPTFNESENIGEFLAALRVEMDAARPGRYELIVVDDDSPDLTWRIALERLDGFPAVRVVRRVGERGLASAVIRGWQTARGSILGTINADFQHPPAILGEMMRAIDSADIVVASRYAEGGRVDAWSAVRRTASRAAHLAGRVLLPEVFGRVSDPLSGCYLCRRDVIADIELRPLGYKTLIEILVRGRGGRISECPYGMAPRQRGQSKLRPLESALYLAQLLRLRAARRVGGSLA